MGAAASTLPDYDPSQHCDETDLCLHPMFYPNGGNYTLQTCPIGKLARMTQEEQMRFSDAITRRYAKNPIFLEKQRGLRDYATISINETAVGNGAFIAHHNPEGYWQDEYRAMITALKDRFPADDEATDKQMERIFGHYP